MLFYSKSAKARVIATRECTADETNQEFSKIDKDGRRYKTGIPLWCQPSMGVRPNLCYKWRGFTNPHPSGWRLSKERMEEEFQKGNVVIRENGKLERRKYEEDYEGKPVGDLWIDISPAKGNERTGYPTQKPVALYERIIKASTNPGDVVLDPFCGCATTLVACERLNPKRQWIGIDIWENAHEIVISRLENEGLIAPKYTRKTPSKRSQYLWAEELHFTDKLPERTDDGETDAPYLKVKSKLKVDEVSDGFSNKERKQKLLDTKGCICQGCGRKFDDERYLELDHNTPRANGGSNNLSNRILLCSPCNRLKSHYYTLSGLIRENKNQGYMVNLKLVDALMKC